MSDMNSLLEVLQGKIQAAADGASPEELAYLGTAVDRIGGRATVHEVMVMGNAKKAELAQIAQDLVDSMSAYTTEEQEKLTATLQQLIQQYADSASAIQQTAQNNLNARLADFSQDVADIREEFDTLLQESSDSLTAKEAQMQEHADGVLKSISESQSTLANGFKLRQLFFSAF